MACSLTVTYVKGQLQRAAVTFKAIVAGVADTAVDPTGVTFKVKPPSGVVFTKVYGVDVDVIKDAVGAYHLDIDASTAGTWFVRVTGSGTYQGAAEGKFVVDAGQF